MRLRRIQQLPIVGATQDIQCPAGKYFGLLLHFTGTNVAAAGTLADLGNVLIRFRGIPIASVSVATLWDYTQLRGGFPVFASAIGGAFEATLLVPFRYGAVNTDNPDDNILNAGANELVFTPQAVAAATFATMTIEVSALLDYGVARYMVQISEQTPLLVGADRPRLSVPNLKNLYISQPSGIGAANPVSVMLTSGSPSVVIFEEAWAQLVALTNIDSAVEAAAVTPIMPDLGSHIFSTWVRGKYELLMLGGAGTVRLCEFGALPVTVPEHESTVKTAENDLLTNITESPAPPDPIVAPPDARQVPIPPGQQLEAPSGITMPGIKVTDLGAASVNRVSTFGA